MQLSSAQHDTARQAETWIGVDELGKSSSDICTFLCSRPHDRTIAYMNWHINWEHWQTVSSILYGCSQLHVRYCCAKDAPEDIYASWTPGLLLSIIRSQSLINVSGCSILALLNCSCRSGRLLLGRQCNTSTKKILLYQFSWGSCTLPSPPLWQQSEWMDWSYIDCARPVSSLSDQLCPSKGCTWHSTMYVYHSSVRWEDRENRGLCLLVVR